MVIILFGEEKVLGRRRVGLVFDLCVFLLFVTVFGMMLNVPLVRGTNVGGIISSNTTWTRGNSPYTITETVQIPSDVTLTIEPGVTVSSLISGDMFLLHGMIYAHGTIDSKIIFDGGGNARFFNVDMSNDDTFLDLDYAIVQNGGSFWWGGPGHFNLTHSELTNLTGNSHVWYPAKDVYIEYNKFINSGGFSVGHSGPSVYIRYNTFKGNRGLVVENWASYSGSTVVKYNSLIDMTGTVLELPPGYTSAAMSATENYWKTQDTNAIDAMIYDKNDDIRCAGYIDYLPILSEPHPAVGTYVGGHISEDTTWAFTDIPYIVVEDVVVEEGVLLTIEPGVVVKFAGETALVTDGALTARGNIADRITFTSNSSTPNPGDWKGIKFRGSSKDSVLNWTIVEYAGSDWYGDWAVYIEGSAVSLVNSVVRSNVYGVEARSGALLIVQNCNITDNMYGIYSESETEIYGSTFIGNEEGVRIGGAQLEIYASTFLNNGKAIREYVSGSYLYMTHSEISNNIDGICWVSYVELSESIISHNSGTGIICQDWDSLQITRSTISGNEQNGITFNGYNPTQKEIHFSNIFDNTPYNIVNNLSYGFDIDATYNWWGTSNEALIEEYIYDYYDDPEWSRVLFKPFLVPPVADFTFSPETPYAFGTVTFDASTSFNLFGSIATYIWNFGDGNTTNVTSPLATHTYMTPGNYEVTLTVTDEFGLMDSTGTSLVVIQDSIPPTTVDDYDRLWRNVDFTIILTAADYESGVSETHYKINDGPTKTVSAHGQPLIKTEDAINTLEYWSVDNAGNEELPHKTLTDIKLDKTAPTGSVIINNGDSYTTSTSVTLTLTATDPTSGVYRVRYSNDGVWDTEPWEDFSTTKTWTLAAGDGTKTVYVQYMNNAGLISSTSQDIIILDTTKPVVKAGQDQTVKVGEAVTFDASASSDNVGIVSYEWDFGDGTTGTGKTTTHAYTEQGTYTATLTARDAGGNIASDSMTVTVGSAEAPTPLPTEAFPTWIIGGAIIAIAIAVAGALLWKRRK